MTPSDFHHTNFEDFGRIGGKGTILTMSLSRVEFLNNEPVFCRAMTKYFQHVDLSISSKITLEEKQQHSDLDMFHHGMPEGHSMAG